MIVTMDQATRSPSVTLADSGALINQSTTPVPFDQVLIKLSQLSPDAWPCGRVLLYSTGNAPKAAADKMTADLQEAGFRLINH